MDEVEISVILAARNRAGRIATALLHLEQQSFPAAQFEIILIDDGSTDGTGEALEKYAAGAPVRTRCFRQPSPGLTRARNRGLREAHGRYVLYLDQDLLASPGLVLRHMEAQRAHDGPICAVGTLEPHPQMARNLFVRMYLPDELKPMRPGGDLHFMDWRCYNASYPREYLLEAGGFDEDFPSRYFADVELAFRLEQLGMRGISAPRAHAYEWLPSQFDADRRRYYRKGYALHYLHERTGANDIYRRFRVFRTPLGRAADALVMPYYKRLCTQTDDDPRMYVHLYRQVLRHELCRGFEDARKGRPPRVGEER